MSVIGIDFGTTNSSASWINPQTHQPEVIVFNETGSSKIPSVVYFPSDGDPIVGLAPFQQLENLSAFSDDARNMIQRSTITSIKRKLKRNGMYLLNGRSFTHLDVVSLILKKIKEESAASCPFEDAIDSVVLTHPVIFEEWKKELLRNAALQAGFNSVVLLEEPVSAAIGYINTNKLKDVKGLLVYDFGGGTFDVAYVKIEDDGRYRIPLMPRGDDQCGGDDIDLILYNKWDSLARQTYNRSISPVTGEVDISFLSRCRKNKELLSRVESSSFSELLPVQGNAQQLQRLQMKITRQQLNEMISPVVDKTIRKTHDLLDDIKEAQLPLDAAILIGGSSRIPMVTDRLRQLLGDVPINTTGKVDVAVALGALSQSTIIRESVRKCFCMKDGRELKTSWQFCPFCGTPNYMYMFKK